MKKKEIGNSLFFVFLGGVFLFLTKGMTAEYYTIGPGFFPRMVAISLIITNIIRFIALVIRPDNEKANISYNDRPLYITTIIFILYAAGNYVIGFTVSSILFLYVLMHLLGNRRRFQKILNSLAVTFVVKAIFKWILVLPLPGGFWNIQ
jgi:hypothetical protein